MPNPAVILSSVQEAEWLERLRTLVPAAELAAPEAARADPALLARVEVAFGGLRREDLAGATGLRWFQALGAGVDGFPTSLLAARGVRVTNASGIHAEPIAEHVFGMLLAGTRRLPEARRLQEAREWRPFEREELSLLVGRTLGLWGVGAIGLKCAEVARALGMRVIGLRRSAEPHPLVERMYGPAELPAFLAGCDVLLNSLPLTPATRGAFGPAELAALKPGAAVVNVGRGGTMDTATLLAGVESGHIGTLLLDVTDPEPLPAEHPLWTHPRVTLTAHYAGAHPGYLDRAGAIFLENLGRYLRDEPLINQVDLDAGY
jgi:D-2-hydroxyacid dehydrogenase (NADP+)